MILVLSAPIASAIPIESGIDIVRLDSLAVRTSTRLAAQAGVADLARQTPCAGWTLRDLLAHLTAQHRGFAAAAAGHTAITAWHPAPPGDDVVGAYRVAADHVLAAFSAPGILDREFVLPEFSARQVFPARQAIGFHFLDYVVHSWDIARTIARPVDFPPDAIAVALGVAVEVPDGAARRAPASPFAPSVPWPTRSSLDRIVALLGRDPNWRRP